MFKKVLFTSLGVFTLGLVFLFLAGPRVKIDTDISLPRLPKTLALEELEGFLAKGESRLPEIVRGAEKKIIWAGETGKRTDISLVYLHGFSACRQETAPLADRVARQVGANLFYTRFTGHGRTGETLAGASVNDWLTDTMEAYEIGRRLGKRVILMGVSTGATAAAWLAAQPDTSALAACVFISPNFGLANIAAKLLTWPWGGHIAKLLVGETRSWEPKNQAHGRYWNTQYPTRALLPMMGMVKLVKSLDLDRFRAPLLVIYSPNDTVVSIKAMESLFRRVDAVKKQLIPFALAQDPDQHVLAGDILSPGTTDQVGRMIVDFITPEI